MLLGDLLYGLALAWHICPLVYYCTSFALHLNGLHFEEADTKHQSHDANGNDDNLAPAN
jgi:hypothetical protein